MSGGLQVGQGFLQLSEAMPDDKPILLLQNFANADQDGDVDEDEEDL